MSQPWTDEDHRWMKRALQLARRGFTTPNPMVGCVLVRKGAIVGEGYHRFAGEAHAEVRALQAAGPAARGATAYVTLEPCSHFGRTPPCTSALIQAGIARVFAAIADADSRVSGQGLAELALAGIQVSVGLLHREAQQLNEDYLYHRETGAPFVTLKAAMTLDGKIATALGSSKWITGEEARRYLHRRRARAGAVLCGIGTLLADDPLLNSRMPRAPRQPLRVILDSQLRTPVTSQIVRTASQFPTLIACLETVDVKKRLLMERQGVEIHAFSADKQARVPLSPLLRELGGRGIVSLLVEGGANVHASFVQNGLFNRLAWFVAAKIIGGAAAPGPVGGEGLAVMDDAIALGRMTITRLGSDLLIEASPPSLRQE